MERCKRRRSLDDQIRLEEKLLRLRDLRLRRQENKEQFKVEKMIELSYQKKVVYTIKSVVITEHRLSPGRTGTVIPEAIEESRGRIHCRSAIFTPKPSY